MIDWHAPMQQSYSFFIVDPGTWTDKEQIRTITSGSILRDSSAETLGSASFNITEELGEVYIRTYLEIQQHKAKERFPLGVHMCQTPEVSFDGKVNDISIDAYTPLLDYKENNPPIGYTIMANANILNTACLLLQQEGRAPIIQATSDATIGSNFTAEPDDNWLSFLQDFIANASYHLDLDEMGRIFLSPEIDLKSMQPVYTFNDDNSSILYPSVRITRDLYGIPNVVEAVYSEDAQCLIARAENNDEDNPMSIKNRGRIVLHRETDPDIPGVPTQQILNSYAAKVLRELSSIEYTVTYTHGYLPTVRVGDCVRLNYTKAGIVDVKAKVTKQSIKLEPGCPVEETAVYTVPFY